MTTQPAASYTEAPWNVEEHGVLRVEDKYGVAIARMGEGHPQEVEANARLIAAAPELLEACIHAVDGAYDSGNEQDGVEITHEAFTWIKAAISKATGTSQL